MSVISLFDVQITLHFSYILSNNDKESGVITFRYKKYSGPIPVGLRRIGDGLVTTDLDFISIRI